MDERGGGPPSLIEPHGIEHQPPHLEAAATVSSLTDHHHHQHHLHHLHPHPPPHLQQQHQHQHHDATAAAEMDQKPTHLNLKIPWSKYWAVDAVWVFVYTLKTKGDQEKWSESLWIQERFVGWFMVAKSKRLFKLVWTTDARYLFTLENYRGEDLMQMLH